MDTILDSTNILLQSSRLLKPREIAGYLNVSRSFAYQLLQTGAIPVVHIGKARRVRPQDLIAYIKQNIYPTGNSA